MTGPEMHQNSGCHLVGPIQIIVCHVDMSRRAIPLFTKTTTTGDSTIQLLRSPRDHASAAEGSGTLKPMRRRRVAS